MCGWRPSLLFSPFDIVQHERCRVARNAQMGTFYEYLTSPLLFGFVRGDSGWILCTQFPILAKPLDQEVAPFICHIYYRGVC